MTLLIRFLVYNLLVSLAAGLFAWLIALGVVRLLKIRSTVASFCFFSLPIFKSLLVLLGIGMVFPWPGQWFEQWRQLALPVSQALLIVLVWGSVTIPIYALLTRQARQAALQDALPAKSTEPRLQFIFERILKSDRLKSCPLCRDDLCCAVELKQQPRLFVSDRIHSPLALTGGGNPSILFPSGLSGQLTDEELAGALAHELAHFYLRRPNWCSAGTLQKLMLINPVSGLVGEYLNRQEEKACDELAVSVVGQPEQYAEMLTRCYRYARDHAVSPARSRLDILPHLFGFKPLLSERVEHLLNTEKTGPGWNHSRIVLCLSWSVLFSLLFFNFSAFPY